MRSSAGWASTAGSSTSGAALAAGLAAGLAGARAAGVPAFTADILPAIADGRIRPLVDRVFPFADLPAARAHMEANAHLGKIVITMAP